MPGLSPKLPVTKDPVDGFSLTKNYKEMIHQNFKNLILTSPGERIMDPNFGVGLRGYLFQQMTPLVFGDIEERIVQQVSTYLPFVEVLDILFSPEEDGEFINSLAVRIEYFIAPIGTVSAFETRIGVT